MESLEQSGGRRLMWSRRELVTAFLGAGVAAAGCRRKERRDSVPGALVDRAVETGHLLREATRPAPATEVRALDVLIVGGGVAGLSAAWRLRAAGLEDLLLVELDESLGGTSRSGRNAVSAFPWGAHYLPAPLETGGPVSRLLRELGAIVGEDEAGHPRFAEQMLIRQPDERLYYKGLWYEGLYLRAGASQDDLAELARFEAQIEQLSAARDGKGRKAFAVPTMLSSDDAEWMALDRISMADWLEQHGYRSRRLRWVVDYGCRDDFGAPAALVSAWAGLWYFCARRDGARENAGYLSWPEGNGRLVSHLASSLEPAQRHTGVLVHTIEPGEDGCLVHAIEAGSRRPLAFQARQVVFAGPRFVAGQVVSPWRRERPGFLAAFEYGPWVVANLSVSSPPRSRGFPLSWDNVLYESRSLGYVVATHQRERADETGPTVLTWYYPLDGADVKAERQRLLDARYPEWEALVMADLRAAHPDIDPLATRLEVMRWGHAMVRPRPGFYGSPERRQAQESLGQHLHFAHSDLGGLAVFEEANAFGVIAAEKVLAGLGRRFDSWL